MRTGPAEVGNLYATTGGRTVEIVAAGSVECIDSAAPVGSTEVIAYHFLGGSVVHLVAVSEVQEWIRVPGV